MKATKSTKLYASLILATCLALIFLVINYSYGFISQHSPIDAALHESKSDRSIPTGTALVDFEMEQGVGQGPFSFSLLPGAWNMSVKVWYDDVILEQHIATCVNWSKGLSPDMSVECGRKLYFAELGSGELVILKASYNFETGEIWNREIVQRITLPISIVNVGDAGRF